MQPILVKETTNGPIWSDQSNAVDCCLFESFWCTLIERVHKVSPVDGSSPVWQQTVATQAVLQDGTWDSFNATTNRTASRSAKAGGPVHAGPYIDLGGDMVRRKASSLPIRGHTNRGRCKLA